MSQNTKSHKLSSKSDSLVSGHNVLLLQQPLYQLLCIEDIPECPSNYTTLVVPVEGVGATVIGENEGAHLMIGSNRP